MKMQRESDMQHDDGNLFVAVAGIIGAGKSSFVRHLSEITGWTPFYEPVETNPYLEKFYADMPRYALEMQIFLLAKRFESHQKINWLEEPVIQDRTIYEDTMFAQILHDLGHIDELGYATYKRLFHIYKRYLVYPDVLIYLNVSPEVALKRTRKRARAGEEAVSLEYLNLLHCEYEVWIEEMAKYTAVLDLDWNTKDESEASMRWAHERVLELVENRQPFIKSIRRL